MSFNNDWIIFASAIIFLVLVLLLEFVRYRGFLKFLSAPFKRIRINNDELFNDYRATSKLYESYKRLPKDLLTIVKLSIRSNDYKHDPFIQMVELLSKLVLTVAIAIMGVVMTMSVAVLNFLQNDNELKKDYHTWFKSVRDMFDNFTSGLNSYLLLLAIGAVVFISSAIHIYFSSQKRRERSRHLIIIEQIEKERLTQSW